MTMLITLHPRRGQSIAELLAEVSDVADGGRTYRTGHGGVDVDEDLALAYLGAREKHERSSRRRKVERDPNTTDPIIPDPTADPGQIRRAPADEGRRVSASRNTDPAETPKTDRRTTPSAEPGDTDPAEVPKTDRRTTETAEPDTDPQAQPTSERRRPARTNRTSSTGNKGTS